jgi:NAD(P)-dependent dehydrogenase (short-subunit alcohol dehydrogenase family)
MTQGNKRRYEGRVAIVTGASRGLGRTYARLLAAEGARVVVNGPTLGDQASTALDVVEEIRAFGGEAVVDLHDVTLNPAAIVTTAVNTWGTVDIVINNAGATDGGGIDEMTPERFERLVDMNFRSSVAVLRAAWPVLKKQRYGRVVNTSSGSVLGLPACFAYQATKSAIIGLTRSLAFDGAPYGIKVNAVCPIAWTAMTAGIPDQQFREFLGAHFSPDLVAPFVGALVADDVPCTGETFSVGGGIASRLVLGFTPGYRAGIAPSIADYLAHFDQICDTDGLVVAEGSMHEIAYRARQLDIEGWAPTLGVAAP